VNDTIEIDWSTTECVHVDLRRRAASHHDPSAYTVTLLGDGTVLNAWGQTEGRLQPWGDDPRETAKAAQRFIDDTQWTPVLVQVDDDIVWRRPLRHVFDDDYERALQEAGLTLLDDLHHCDDLTDIEGIGEAGAEQIREAME